MPPGPHTMQCQRAAAELSHLLIDWQARHNLTDIEALIEINIQSQRLLEYPLRAERHPDDPNKKADEA